MFAAAVFLQGLGRVLTVAATAMVAGPKILVSFGFGSSASRLGGGGSVAGGGAVAMLALLAGFVLDRGRDPRIIHLHLNS